MSLTSTHAPSRANASAMALPIPWAAPVTIVVLSFSLIAHSPQVHRFLPGDSQMRSRDPIAPEVGDVNPVEIVAAEREVGGPRDQDRVMIPAQELPLLSVGAKLPQLIRC